jgi:hypothetical protein
MCGDNRQVAYYPHTLGWDGGEVLVLRGIENQRQCLSLRNFGVSLVFYIRGLVLITRIGRHIIFCSCLTSLKLSFCSRDTYDQG